MGAIIRENIQCLNITLCYHLIYYFYRLGTCFTNNEIGHLLGQVVKRRHFVAESGQNVGISANSVLRVKHILQQFIYNRDNHHPPEGLASHDDAYWTVT